MKYIKPMTVLILITSLLLFNACGSRKASNNKDGYSYSGIYFGKHFTPNYKKGIKDGCITAKGDYKKSHRLFNNDYDYNKGWFLGRNRCKDLLVIEEDKK